MNIVIILGIIITAICIFLVFFKKDKREEFTLVPLENKCDTNIILNSNIAPQTIKCETTYEIEKNNEPKKEIVIDELYTLEKPDIQYYADIKAEYEKKLTEHNLQDTRNYPQIVLLPSNEVREFHFNDQIDYIQPNNPIPFIDNIENHLPFLLETEPFAMEMNIGIPLRTTRRNEPLNVEPPEVAFFADNQNVHNNTIQKSIKQKYNTLNKKVDNINVTGEIDKWTKSDPQIIDIINQIKTRNSYITNLDMDSEMGVLTKVWVNAKDDNERNAIIDELRDSVDSDGKIYCPTGTTVRLVNSTWINNPEEMPKTKSMIHTEMMNTASSIRDSLEINKDLPENEQDKLFKDTLMEKYTTDYKGILTETEIKDMTGEWIDLI